MELFIDGVQMRPHRAQADAELVGDFLVEITLGEQPENFVFAFGQFFRETPNFKFQTCRRLAALELGPWSFFGVWSLEFGALIGALFVFSSILRTAR